MIKYIALISLLHGWAVQAVEDVRQQIFAQHAKLLGLEPPIFKKNLKFDSYTLSNRDIIQSLLIRFYGKNLEQINSHRATIMIQAESIANNSQHLCMHIPHVMHRLWITNPTNPHEPPEEAIDRYIQSINFSDKNWKHYLWCQDPTLLPNTVKRLEKQRVIIRTLKELEPFKGEKIVDFYLENQQYCFASDIVRLNIVNQEPGVYVDIGWITKDLNFICDHYHHFFYQLHQGAFDLNFFGCSKESFIFKKILDLLDDLSWISEDMKEHIKSDPLNKHLVIGHPHLNVIASLFKPEDVSILVLSKKNKQIFEPYRLGSWGDKERFGNQNFREVENNLF